MNDTAMNDTALFDAELIGPELIAGSRARPELVGSRCNDCGERQFPPRPYCARCQSRDIESISLGRRGRLWSWTIQGFPPPPPYRGNTTEFAPFGVGYVELDCGVKVESRLIEHMPEQLQIGMPMELLLETLTDNSGEARQVYAFRRAQEVSHD